MVDRINLILKAKNLTSRQFAEEIGIQPSGMSHILSGRNRPSLDFVMKVVTRYPEIDIKWLTLGEGEMYVSPYSMPVVASAPLSQGISASEVRRTEMPPLPSRPEPIQSPEPDLFTLSESDEDFEKPIVAAEDAEPASEPTSEPVEASAEPDVPSQPQLDENRLCGLNQDAGAEKRNLKKKRIVKVVILYDDHSFSEYYPE